MLQLYVNVLHEIVRDLTCLSCFHARLSQAKYSDGHVPISRKVTLLVRDDERGDTFGFDKTGEPKPDKVMLTKDLFWGQVDLDQCSKNLKIEWNVQTGCKMGLLDKLDVQWQMTSATSTQCDYNNERCVYNKDAVSETESGWWKSLHVCRGANPFSELGPTGHLIIPDDCGFGGVCGSTSVHHSGVQIGEPMCPYVSLGPGDMDEVTEWFPNPSDAFTASTSLPASDALCGCNAARQELDGQECHDATVFPQDCMCSGAGSSCNCKDQYHTTGEYLLEDPFGSANIDCLKTNSTSCRVTALLKLSLKIDSPTPSFEHFKIKDLHVSCDSDFVLAPGVVSDDGSTITCPLPRIEPGDGAEGVMLQLSLNGKDWEEPIDFPYLEPPSVASIEPKFGITSGGTNVTVTGHNFVNDPPIYCFWVDPSTNREIRVVAQFMTTRRLICVAPSVDQVHNVTEGGLEPFTALKYAVYVSLNGRERGASAVNGSSQDSSFNYFRTPKIEAVSPDSGFTSRNQSITVYGTHLCLHHSPHATGSCRPLIVKMTYPAHCTRDGVPGAHCTEVLRRGQVILPDDATLAATGYAYDVHVQVWDIGNLDLKLRSNDTYAVGLEFQVEGTSAILHTHEYTFYDSLRPPDGCQEVGDFPPFELKCQCLFRDPENQGEYRITDFNDDYDSMTTVPSRRFDLCEPAPYLTTATLLLTPSHGGAMIRLGARSFPDWTRW